MQRTRRAAKPRSERNTKGQKRLMFPNGHGGNRKQGWAQRQRRRGIRVPVPHRSRDGVHERHPLHVTMRVRAGLESLRSPRCFAVVRGALRESSRYEGVRHESLRRESRCLGSRGSGSGHGSRLDGSRLDGSRLDGSRLDGPRLDGPRREGPRREGPRREGFRLNHFSVQSNHLHLIVEAQDRVALARGMTGLATRLARRLNRLWNRRGAVFAERFHALALKSGGQVRSALRYVLNNVLRHGGRKPLRRDDPCSSGAWFDGWRHARPRSLADPSCPIAPPRSFLLRLGWRRHGLIGLDEPPVGAL